jgi:hypothetical protein
MRFMSYAFTTCLLIAAIAVPEAVAGPAQDPPVSPTPVAPGGQLSWPRDAQKPRAHTAVAPTEPRAWPSDPRRSTPAEPQPAPADGFPWATVGLILAGAGIGLAGAVALVRVRRGPHVTA